MPWEVFGSLAEVLDNRLSDYTLDNIAFMESDSYLKILAAITNDPDALSLISTMRKCTSLTVAQNILGGSSHLSKELTRWR